MCGTSLKKVGGAVFELLIGNKKVTDGETYRRMDLQTDRPSAMCKAICPLFFEGGHKKHDRQKVTFENVECSYIWNRNLKEGL